MGDQKPPPARWDLTNVKTENAARARGSRAVMDLAIAVTIGRNPRPDIAGESYQRSQ